jgi:tryptophanyl-tRNA synthetase
LTAGASTETVLSGIQPSGEIHIGNYLGAIRNWVAMQDTYRCFFCVVDYHAITTEYEPATLAPRTLDLAAGILACGVDPERATLFIQSHVPEHTELAWVLTCITPMGELSRMTQFKDKSASNESVNAGLLAYPVLQAADILLYRADRVPVGADQVQHLELCRELARRFNARFGDTFREPQPLLSSTPKIMGLDGQAKMSKSLGNTIALSESADGLRARLRTAYTDPQRKRRSDPGRPEVCNIFTMHGFFTERARVDEIAAQCRAATIGCVECKGILADRMLPHLAAIQQRYTSVRADETRLLAILAAGAERARGVARATMDSVRSRLGLAR